MGSTRASRAVRGTVWYVFSAFNECLPLPARNERGEGRVLASLSNAVSSPWPSPSSGQERGEENSAQGYNLSNAINGHSIAPERFILQPCFQKESEINDPGPARLFTFLDVHEQGIIDSTFGILPPGWNSPLRWWDLPADRHNQGCDLAFADGHAEHWRWAAPKIFEKVGQDIRDAGDIKDFRRVQAGVRPETRF